MKYLKRDDMICEDCLTILLNNLPYDTLAVLIALKDTNNPTAKTKYELMEETKLSISRVENGILQLQAIGLITTLPPIGRKRAHRYCLSKLGEIVPW